MIRGIFIGKGVLLVASIADVVCIAVVAPSTVVGIIGNGVVLCVEGAGSGNLMATLQLLKHGVFSIWQTSLVARICY